MEAQQSTVSDVRKALDINGLIYRKDLHAKRLVQEAGSMMKDELKQTAQDPIHVIAAAAGDAYIPLEARTLLLSRGITRASALDAARYDVPETEHRGKKAKNGLKPDFFSDYGVELYARLYDKYEVYLETNVSSFGTSWDWYAELLLLALESQSPAVVRLLG